MYNYNIKELFLEGLSIYLDLNDIIEEIKLLNIDISEEIQNVIESLLYCKGSEKVFGNNFDKHDNSSLDVTDTSSK
ncbi:hypothetical protein EPTV-WA-030 [Eptesipox virus]|uniref:Uncharacterized protein n=1 Tax=Eptesipox virus TaxID=1329402 RepID=A0A220T689_9POXV|nr:hypothetical protein CG743_gp030 [Eptesipox virus]ASK51231.1 hypothetical protein EPTV-WA-030 [Eptesipox virus]WAH70989.1 hypothetical protein CG743_gp030 [Eptesipox virus]